MDAMKFFAVGLIGFIFTIIVYIVYEKFKEHYFYFNPIIALIIIATIIVATYLTINYFKKQF
jgi:uncharacterized membrane protein YhhN